MDDVDFYRNHKPGFGDDGGYATASDGDIQRMYFGKVVNTFSLNFAFEFQSQEGADNFADREKSSVDLANNTANVLVGIASGGLGKAAGITGILVGLMDPDFFQSLMPIDPKAGTS